MGLYRNLGGKEAGGGGFPGLRVSLHRKGFGLRLRLRGLSQKGGDGPARHRDLNL